MEIRRWALALFFLSGIAGLIYEIVWTKLFSLVLGNTIFSVSVVVAAFMGGLALGSYVAGRVGHHVRNPLRIYGLLELGVAGYCLAVPFLIDAAEPVFRTLYRQCQEAPYLLNLERSVIGALILLPPTTAMGATLPILARLTVVRADAVCGSVGALYGLNTLGAVLGASTTGLVLIPWIGLRLTTSVGALISAMAGFGALLLSRGRGQPFSHATIAAHSPVNTASARLLLLAFGVASFASMVNQIAWTRALVLAIGSTVHAFSLILTSIILGLALGAVAFTRRLDRVHDPVFSFALLQGGVSILSLAVVPLLGRLPLLVPELLLPGIESFGLTLATQFCVVLAIVILPSILIGAAFPLVARALTPTIEGIGISVGTAYAVSTVGAIAGSFSGGLLLLPSPLGAHGTLLAAAGLNVLAALIALVASTGSPRRRAIAATGCVGAVLLLELALLPRWDTRVLSSGGYGPLLLRLDLDERAKRIFRHSRVLFYRDGVSATVAVKEFHDGSHALLTNGKVDASSVGDMPTQVLSGELPMLLHVADSQDVLVIGLGGGVTLGSILRHPVRSVDCVELSADVVEAAGTHFEDVNHGALRDGRVRMLVTDGRNHVAMTDRRYDVVSSVPSNPWMAGIGSLFTREFFRACRARLNPRGLMCQWIATTALSESDMRSVLATFTEVFPETLLFESVMGIDYLMIGFVDRAILDTRFISTALSMPRVSEDLARIGIDGVDDVIAHFVCGPERLRSCAIGARVNTDDNCLLELSSPRSLYRDDLPDHMRFLQSIREPASPFVEPKGGTPIGPEMISSVFEARGLVIRAYLSFANGDDEAVEPSLRRALELHPGDVAASRHLLEYLRENARATLRDQRPEQALTEVDEALAIQDGDFESLDVRGHALAALHRYQEALSVFEKQLALRPASSAARLNRGETLLRLGRAEEAARDFEVVAAAQPDNPDVLFSLGNARYRSGHYLAAADCYERVADLEPDFVDLRRRLGLAYVKGGRPLDGVRELDRATNAAPHDADAWQALAQALEEINRPADARKARRRAEEIRAVRRP